MDLNFSYPIGANNAAVYSFRLMIVIMLTSTTVLADGFPITNGRYAGGKITILRLNKIQQEKLDDYLYMELTPAQKAVLGHESSKIPPDVLLVFDVRGGAVPESPTDEAIDVAFRFASDRIEVPHLYVNRYPALRALWLYNYRKTDGPPEHGRRVPFDLNQFFYTAKFCSEANHKTAPSCQSFSDEKAKMERKYSSNPKLKLLISQVLDYYQQRSDTKKPELAR